MSIVKRSLWIVFITLLYSASLYATKTYVNQDNSSGVETGLTPDRGYLTIQEAMSSINGDDSLPDTLLIVASDSLYTTSITLDKSLTIIGVPSNAGPDSVVLTAQDSSVFKVPTYNSDFEPVEATWEDLVFQDSYQAISGTISLDAGMALRFKNCVFRRVNGADNAAGIKIRAEGNAVIEIDSCEFTSLYNGISSSAININFSDSVQISHSTFRENQTTSKEGGAVSVQNANHVQILHSSFIDNTDSTNIGGAVYVDPQGSVEIAYSNFFGNTAAENIGGAVYANSANNGEVALHHNIFAGNTAVNGGAFAMSSRGRPNIYNNTFYNNSATNNGLDIFVDEVPVPHTIRNNIFSGNDTEVEAGQKYIRINLPTSSPPPVDISYNRMPEDGASHSNSGNYDSDPQFLNTSPVDPAQMDFHLSGSSYLINKGAPKDETFGDYLNEPEPNGDRVNIGRYGNTAEASIANYIQMTHVSSPLVPQSDTLLPPDAYVEAIADSNWWYHIELNPGNSDTIVNESSFYFDSLTTNRGGVGWIPENKHVGQHNVSFNISDGPTSQNRSTNASMTISVSNVNDTVQFVSIPGDTSIAEDSVIVLQFHTFDPDTIWGDEPTFYTTAGRDSLFINTIDQSTGELTWTPGNADVGLNQLAVVAEDDSGATDTAYVNITVTNSEPLLAEQNDTTATEADSTIIDLEELTEDEGSKSGAYYSVAKGPDWLAFHTASDSSAGLLRGVPNNDDVTIGFSDSVVVEFTDGNGGTSQDTFLITVQNKNNSPDSTGVPNWTTLLEDTTYIGYFTFHDSDLVHLGEDNLTFELDYDESTASVQKVGDDSAQVTWTPWNDEVGEREIRVIARDDAGDSARASIRVTIANQPPTMADTIRWEVYQGNENTLDLQASDEGAASAGYQFTSPADIDTSMTMNQSSGEISYNPSNPEVGEHFLDIEFNDGQEPDSVVSSVLAVNVLNTNDPPHITSADTASVDEDSLFIYRITAIDPDSATGDTTFAFSLQDTLEHMTFTGDSIIWRPYNADVGDNTIRIYATDDSAATDTLDLTVTVRNTNDAPQYFTSFADTTITEDSTFAVTIVANDSDLTHGSEVLTFATPLFATDSTNYTPEAYTLTKNTDSTAIFAWQPPNKNVGVWSLQFPLQDGSGAVDTFETQITVANVVAEQIIIPDTTIGEDTLWTYDAGYSDEDTSAGWWKAFYSIDVGTQFADPSWISVDSSFGLISAMPDQAQVDSSGISAIPVTLNFTDGHGGARSTAFNMTVTNRNDPPEFSTDTSSIQIQEGQRWQASDAAAEQEGQTVTYSDTVFASTNGKDPEGLEFYPTAQTKFDWLIPRGEGYDGTYYIGLYARDTEGAYDTLVYELQVVDAPDPPVITQFPDTLYATQGQSSAYNFEATDLDYLSQDNDVITWNILSSGDLSGFLSIAAQNDSGSAATLEWSTPPSNAVVGNHQVFIRLSDDREASADTDSSFIMVVRNINDAPNIAGIADSLIQGTERQRLDFPFTLEEIDRGDSVTFSFAPAEYNAQLSVSQTPVSETESPDSSVALVWQSPPDKYTLYNFITMYATDDSGAVDTVDFQIYIENVNSKPTYVTTQDQISAATQDQIYYQQLEANDPDQADSNADITWIIDSTSTNTPFHFVLNDTPVDTVTGETALLQWDRPRNVDAHPDTVRGVQVMIVDTAGAFNKKWYTIPVQNVNDAPSFAQIDSQQTIEGQAWSLSVEPYLIEPDSAHGDFSTYSFNQSQPPPDGMTIDANAGVISWTPTNEYALGGGNHRVYVQATDQSGTTGAGSFIVHVSNVNSPPVFTSTTSALPDTAIVNSQYVAEINATDPDPTDDVITFTKGANNPTDVSVVRNDDGTDTSTATVSWEPEPGQAGVHTLRMRVRDNHGVYADSNLIWDVTVIDTVNRAPTLTNFNPDTAATQGKIYQEQFQASDLNPGDVDDLVWSLPVKPANMSINASTGLLTWDSPNNQAAVESPVNVTVRVTDPGGLFEQQSYLITVKNINDAPEITSTAITEAKEDTLYSYEIQARDVDTDTEDSDSLRYQVQMNPNPAWLQYDIENKLLFGTPEQPDTQRTEITVTVTDDSGATAQQIFTLQFRNTNDAPKIVSPQVFPGFTQNVLDSLQVTASDTDNVFFYDSVYFSIGNLPENATSLGDTSWFRPIDNLSAMFYWRPNNNYVPDSTITIMATDTSGASKSVVYDVAVDNRNDPPILTSLQADTLTENEPWTYSITSIDPDSVVGETDVNYSLLNSFSGMTLSGNQIQWTPDNASVGDTLLQVVATDDSSAHDTLNVALHILNANNPPVARSMADTTAIEDQFFTRTIRYTEPDSAFGDYVTFHLDAAPVGMQVDEEAGELTWTPVNADVPDSHKVRYTITDTSGAAATDSFAIAVQNVNDSPVHVGNPELTVTEGELWSYQQLLIDDPDVNIGEDTLQYFALDKPREMSVDPDSGFINWIPADDDTDEDGSNITFTLGAVDSENDSVLVPLTLTMLNRPSPPRFTNLVDTTISQADTFEFTVVAEDPDPDGIVTSYEMLEAPSPFSGEFTTTTGDLTWYPVNENVGTDTLIFQASDADDSLAVDTMYVHVINANDPPVFAGTVDTVAYEDSLYQQTFIAEDPDADVGASVNLTFTLQKSPPWMNLSSAGADSMVLTGQPLNKHVGPDSVVVEVSDDSSYAYLRFLLTTENTNDSPIIQSVVSNANKTVAEGEHWTYQFTARDVDLIHTPVQDSLWLVGVDIPEGMVLDSSLQRIGTDSVTGLIQWTPDNDAAVLGSIPVTIGVQDEGGNQVNQSFTLTVTNTNNAPFFAADTLEISAFERDSLVVPLEVTEPDSFDGDFVGFSIGSGADPGMFLTAISEQYSELHWYPENRHVQQQFYVQMLGTDQAGKSDTLIAHIDVQNRNTVPEIRNTLPPLVLNEDSLWTDTLIVRDFDVDILQDTVRYTLENAPANLTVTPEYLSASADSLFIFSWQPDNGQVVPDSQFTVHFTDDSAETVSQVISYSVLNTNDPPVFANDSLTTEINEDTLFTHIFEVADDDSVYGDSLTFRYDEESIIPDSLLLDSANGMLAWIPRNHQANQVYQFNVIVSDTSGLEDTVNVSLDVNNVNNAPVFMYPPEDTTFVVRQDSLWELNYVLTDEDTLFGDFASIGNMPNPEGVQIIPADSLIRWQPDSSDIGLHEIKLNAIDTGALEDTLTFFVRIEDVNDSPRITSPPPGSNFAVDQDSLLEVTVTAEDADTVYGDDYLRFAWDTTTISLEDNLPEIDSASGEVTWRPNNAQYGTHQFIAIVRDSSGLADSVDLNITVNDLNDAPYFTMVLDTLYFTEDADSTHRAVFGYDPDLFHIPASGSQDSIQFELASLQSPETDGLTITTVDDTVGVLQWMPTNDQVGLYDITVGVHDTSGVSVSDTTITVIVQNRNNPPAITSGEFPSLVFDEDTELSIDLSQYVEDIDAGTEPADIFWRVSHVDTSQQKTLISRIGAGKSDKSRRGVIKGGISVFPRIAESPVHIDTTALPIVRFYADTNYFSTDSVRFRFIASDPEAYTDTLERGVWVSSINDKPVLSSLPDSITNEDTPFAIDVRTWNAYVSDVETDTSDVLWEMVTEGSHFVQDNTGEEYTIEPDTNWFGEDSILIIVTDEDAASDSAWWHITVNSVNDAPYFVEQPGDTTFVEDDSVTISLSQYVADVDHPVSELRWEFTAAGGGEGAFGANVSAGTRKRTSKDRSVNRRIEVGRSGVIMRFSPAADSVFRIGEFIFNYDSDAQEVTITGTQDYYSEGFHQFQFGVSDPLGAEDSSVVAIAIDKANDPPVLSPLETLAFAEDDSITISVDSLVTDVDDIIDSLHWYITLDSLYEPNYASLGQSRGYYEQISATDTLYAFHRPPESFISGRGERMTLFASENYFNTPGQSVRVYLGVVDTSNNRAVRSTLLQVNAVNDPPQRTSPLSNTDLSQTYLREESESVIIGLDSVFTDVDDPFPALRWHISVDSSAIPEVRYDSVQTVIESDSESVQLRLRPTWNYAGEETYYLSVTDTSNTTSWDTLHFSVIDTIPPVVDIGVLQHPLITSSVELYFFFSEDVTRNPRPKLWLQQPNAADSTFVQARDFIELPWGEHMNPPLPFYHQLRIEEPGMVELYLKDVVDVDNPEMRGDRQFTFGADSVPALAKVTLAAPGEGATLSIPSKGVDKSGYWLSYEPALALDIRGLAKKPDPKNFTALPEEKEVKRIVRFDGPVRQFRREARIGFSIDVNSDEWRNASVVRLIGGRWELLESYFSPNSEQVWSYTDQPGTYGILWESGVPVNILPEEYNLSQNYPNPFNPSTMIEYAIPDVTNNQNGIQNVRLDIYNILGQKVRTLVNTPQKPGLYSIQWDGRDNAGTQLASGIYFYRIQAGNYTKAKKMVLIR